MSSDDNVKNHVNSTQLFETIMFHVNRKNTTFSNLYDSLSYSNSSNSSTLENLAKHRRDTSKIRITPGKSKTVIRSSDHKRQRPRKDIQKMQQVQHELNNDYFVRDEGAEVGRNEQMVEYDVNTDAQNNEDEKLYNHKLDRSLFDRTNHNYNSNNPIHSINQLYTSFQSQDMSDYSTYATNNKNRNIEQNPMTPYFESSSILPSFTTPRTYQDSNMMRKFPQGYYYMRATTTTESPDYEYFEEEVQELPIIEAKKRWSQPALNNYNFRPLSKLSSGYGYGYSAPDQYHTGYGSSGPSYHPDYGHSAHGHSGSHGHTHHHIPVITETIIHKPAPHKFDFKKLAIIALLKFGLSKLKWFLLLKLLLLKLLKLKFILFLLFLKLYLFFKFLKFLKFLKLLLIPLLLLPVKLKFILFLLFLKLYLFFKFLKFLKFLKLLLIPLLLLPLLPLLLLASLLLFLPVPVLAPASTATTTFFVPGTGKRRRRRRDIVGVGKYPVDVKFGNFLDSEEALLLVQRIQGAEEFIVKLVCDNQDGRRESNSVYRWLSQLSSAFGLTNSRFCDKMV
ncbi:uncharacterized protein LOC113469028 [Diaphorina citri]|uniref:Uncharacterized protein LOC113469028 n=1 Tax=Diaphorina citri TaxID=121845 RepID=A0A3Q0J197_DIACI|nr:uncharacterized protein LOC113469028 [Diaphorina citri]